MKKKLKHSQQKKFNLDKDRPLPQTDCFQRLKLKLRILKRSRNVGNMRQLLKVRRQKLKKPKT